MTRERFEFIQSEFKLAIASQPSFGSDAPLLLWGETLAALGQALRKLAAWESCGLTEEMLRNHDGYLKLNRGVVMVSEHYLAELQAKRDTAERDQAIAERDALTIEKDGLLILIKDLYRERDGWKDAAAQYLQNQEYYMSLLDEIGTVFGPSAHIADDGSYNIKPLRAKLPEVATALVAERDAAIGQRDIVAQRVRELEEEVESLKLGYRGFP